MNLLLASLLFLAFVGGMLALHSRERRQLFVRWRAFANDKKLECSQSSFLAYPRIHGTLEGVPVEVYVQQGTLEDSQELNTCAGATSPLVLPRNLHVSEEGLLARLGKALVGQDIQTEDPELDSALILRGADRQEVLDFFRRSGVREAVLRFVRSGGLISGQSLIVQDRGITWDGDQLEAMLRAIVAVARALNASAEP